MRLCACREAHSPRRVVLTGGPGAGKTAVLELVRRSLCEHVVVLPESASIVFGGGFPRSTGTEQRRAAQRAIFCVQRELETAAEVERPAIVLCDRGTVDGAAYWPGPDTLWSSVGTTREEQLARYAAVIHLHPPTSALGYDNTNPLRVESVLDAALVDERIAREWEGHPRRRVIAASADFLMKATRALELLAAELPQCCRSHLPPLGDADERISPRAEFSDVEVPA